MVKYSQPLYKMAEECEKRLTIRHEETLQSLQKEILLVLRLLKKETDGEDTRVQQTQPVVEDVQRDEADEGVQGELSYEEQNGELPLDPPEQQTQLAVVEDDEEAECEQGSDQSEVEIIYEKCAQNEHYQELLDLETIGFVPNTEPFECPICFDFLDCYDGVILRDCLHTFCKDCLSRTVELNEAAEVKCPYVCDVYACDSFLQDREIKTIVSKEIYEKHLVKSVALAEYIMSNTFHCKTADCRGWCVFEDDVNAFLCPVCQNVNCLSCQVIHEGQTCKQYQEEIKRLAEFDADARRTKEKLEEMLLKGEAMACPTCQILIMHKGGCDWVRCTMCRTEICWATRGPRWGPRGQGDTSGGCKCRVNGISCHPRCRNCH